MVYLQIFSFLSRRDRDSERGPLNPRVERADSSSEVLGNQHDVDDIHYAIAVDVD